MGDLESGAIFEQIERRDFSALTTQVYLAEPLLAQLAARIRPNRDLYVPLLLTSITVPRHTRGGYEWNLGFIVRHLDPVYLAETLSRFGDALDSSEAIAWALGELGNDDERIISYLYTVCERCADYRAWWCAGISLEKLGACDSVDILKRTLKGGQWDSLDSCFAHLAERPARIAILRHARADNVRAQIVPKLVVALDSSDHDVIENAVWILERLRVSEPALITKLLAILSKSEDKSDTLHPRIVEALGEIATESCRTILEQALLTAKYYRTRSYAARGLAKIGNRRSLPVLRQAFEQELEPGVIESISTAIYTLTDKRRLKRAQFRRNAIWPETGLVFDESNVWYGNPEIYDAFSQAEDPEHISFDFAIGQIPSSARRIADLGTGTGRFALRIAHNRPAIQTLLGCDRSPAMLTWLSQRLSNHTPRDRNRIKLIRCDLGRLPFPDQSVDAVVSSWGFPSGLWDRPRCAREVAEVARVLCPGGVMVTLGWDESFRDELSEFWFRFVPEPDFRRESFEDWRRRRREKVRSPRNCGLTFVKTSIKVPLRFDSVEAAATVMGYLFGQSAGDLVLERGRSDYEIRVGVTVDTKEQIENARLSGKQ